MRRTKPIPKLESIIRMDRSIKEVLLVSSYATEDIRGVVKERLISILDYLIHEQGSSTIEIRYIDEKVYTITLPQLNSFKVERVKSTYINTDEFIFYLNGGGYNINTKVSLSSKIQLRFRYSRDKLWLVYIDSDFYRR